MARRATDTALLTLSMALLGALPAMAEIDRRYVALVERYPRSQPETAVYGVDEWSVDQVNRFAQEVHTLATRGGPAAQGETAARVLQARWLRSAVMLHLDRDGADHPLTNDREHARPCPGPQAAVAARYATILALDGATRPFAKLFFLALTRVSQWDACLSAAEKWAREGLKLFPNDADLLLAVGSALEENATVAWDESIPNPFPSPRYRAGVRVDTANRRFLLDDARRQYESALAADDALHAARLRLGRVLWRQGKAEAAQAALERVVAEAKEVELRFLGHLFLGRVLEDAGRLDDATGHYWRALALDPRSQSAGLALAHALRLGGDDAEARAVAEKAVSFAGQRGGRDWFWTYLTESVSPDDLLTELRRQVDP
jgi:tetratricopeptide (TPR) repeat protein